MQKTNLQEYVDPLVDPNNDLTIHVIPQSHIDLAWNWRWSDTVKMIYDTLNGHASILERNPEATYAQSQIHVYWTVERLFPSLFRRIKKLVKRGQWEIVGGEWVETDHLIPCGESLVRHFLIGQHYSRQRFGIKSRVGWAPDAFGHSPNLPQVMLKSGIEAFIFKRPREKFMKLPDVPFWWVGLDGSKMLSLRVNNKGVGLPQVSEGRVLPEGTNEVTHLQNEFAKHGIHHLWGALGVGDVGGVNEYPKKAMGKNWRMVFSTPSCFVARIREEMNSLPIVEGELGGINVGTYTTHVDMKEGNRRAESQLFIAEFLASLAFVFGQMYPKEEIGQLWRRLIFNHFHDIISGTSVPQVHHDARHEFNEVTLACEDLQRRALYFLAEKIDTRGEGAPIIVFNPLNWTRTDVVEVEIDRIEGSDALEAIDAEGSKSPVQILEERAFQRWKRQRVMFLAHDVPPLGYKVVWLRATLPRKEKKSIYRNIIENEFYKIVGDPKTGYLSSIVDKKMSREVIKPGSTASRWVIFEEGHYIQDYDQDLRAWNLGLTGRIDEAEKMDVPCLIEDGPLRKTLRLTHKYGESQFEQLVHLYRGLPRIDVTVRVRWREVEKLARLDFPWNLDDPKVVAEVPFGAIQRPTDGTEFPVQRWVDMSDVKWGVTLLNNARYGHSAQKNHVRMSVLRCSTQPDPRSDYGNYEFEYAICPHSGTWFEAHVQRMGSAFNSPLIGFETSARKDSLPSKLSFASIGDPSILVSSLKMSEEGHDVILRLYEATGSNVTTDLELNGTVFASETSLEETNLLEEPVKKVGARNKDGTRKVEFSPFEIKTLRISLASKHKTVQPR